jgi:hypothetical protein
VATIETLTVELANDGTITLTIEADFLAMCIEDFSLVKELAELVRNVGGTLAAPGPTAVVAPKPKPAKKAAPTKGGTGGSRATKYDYVEVARIAGAAVRASEPSNGAVAQRFGVSKDMADQLIYRARKLGHDIPRRGDKPKTRSNVAPIARPPTPKPVVHEGNRAFTPGDTLQMIEGGCQVVPAQYRGTEPCAACRDAYALDAQFSRPSRASVNA